MKRLIFTLTAVMLFSFQGFAAQKRILVNTAEEFINALGSNREIVICNEEGLLLTPTIEKMIAEHKLKKYDYGSRAPQDGIMYEDEFDGPTMVLAGIKNLTISSGDASRRSSIEVTPRYANVLGFIACDNLVFRNLLLGHTKEGYCTNGVLGFDGCNGITIDNCGLFGCGTEGIELRRCNNFRMNDSEIFQCAYHIMHLFGSSNCTFTNCVFYQNKEFEQVSVDGECVNVLFEKCVFIDNQGPLFNFGNQDEVKLRRCVISHSGSLGLESLEVGEDCIWSVK